MEKDDEKFFYEDEVAMVSSKSGLVKYGLVLTTNRSRSETELKKSSYKNHNDIKVIWHPNGTEEIIPDDKVYYFFSYMNNLSVLKLEPYFFLTS